MKVKSIPHLLVSMLVFAVAAATAQAQTAPKMKMTTEVPPGIAIPDEVNTRLGTLGGYTVVPPTAGTVVEDLPEGGEEVRVGDITYVKVGETYYQPIQQDGKDMYEVVEVKEGEE